MNDVPLLNRAYLPADYREACGNVQVAKMVFVQCDTLATQALAELEWVTALVEEEQRLCGAVPFAPI